MARQEDSGKGGGTGAWPVSAQIDRVLPQWPAAPVVDCLVALRDIDKRAGKAGTR